ncbi:diguanylate cyclase [bacterium]|nr:diguanylate cyclase [bacterium]MBU1991125.1 diguanylate cyclase [bacterium]
MKHSINKIFNNLSLFLLTMLTVASIATLLIFESNASHSKIDNLNKQKEIISSLTTLEKKDIELAIIQFNGKSIQLHHEIEKLKNLYKYDYTGRYILNNSQEYLSDLDTLSDLTTQFNMQAGHYYTKDTDKEALKKEALKNAFDAINTHINKIIFKNIEYDKQKFALLEKMSLASFALIFIFTIWYRKRLNAIYQDILFLYSVDKNKKDYTIFSEEIDAIYLRMRRKPVITDNPAMIDSLTGINNVKGMLRSYSEKKGMKDSNFTSLSVLEINNFSKSNRAFSQEFTQSVLKKLAFTISLYEQATDVIARTDYNQFTIILSRASKEQSFKDIDIIRQSISELKFKTPDKESVQITVSGGFVIKPSNISLDESIKHAKEILEYAKTHGRNKILQQRDLTELDL